MNDSLPTDASQTDGFALDALTHFRQDWEDRVEPDLFKFVATRAAAVSDRELVELVKVDLDRRWRSGCGSLLEVYLRAWPRLAESSAPGCELLAAEYLARSTYHTRPCDGELAARFPEFAAGLSRPDLDRQAQAARLRESYEGTGRFFLVRRVGSGGMGEVFAALDRERQGLVALKTLPSTHPELLYKFKHEFRALAEVAHPNLVPLYELVSSGDKWFFTMELIDGVDLLSYVRRTPAAADAETRTFSPPTGEPAAGHVLPLRGGAAGRINVADVHDVLRQLVAGLTALHQAGRLHRDIKPSNVLVRPDGRVIILDFGLIAEMDDDASDRDADRAGDRPPGSRSADAYRTDWTAVGTAAYMSPEQAAGRPLTPATDWYAVGVMLYMILTGQRPFSGPTERVLAQKRWGEPPSPSDQQSDVPPHLGELCERLLRRDPAQRADGAEVLARLSAGPLSPPAPPRTAAVRDAPFVGRLGPLRQLHAAFDAMRGGATVVVDVSGSSGVGKTRLVRQFLRSATRDSDAVVLEGRCYERESVPYKALDLLIDSLSRCLSSLPRADADALLPQDVGALIRLFPVLRRVPAVAAAAGPPLETVEALEMRQRASHALRELLLRIGDRRPLVLWIDDLQWDDADSAAVLSTIIRQSRAGRLLLIVSLRSEQAQRTACLTAIDEAVSHRSAQGDACLRRSIELAPLQNDESDELARHLLRDLPAEAAEVIQMVARQSQGTPYFLHELARYVASHGSELLSSAALAQIELQEVLRSRIESLAEAERRLLEAVSIAGRPVKVKTAYVAAGLDPANHQAVVSLTAAHLLRTTGPRLHDEIDVFHDRLRLSVVSLLTEEPLRARHARLATALEEDGEDPEMIATHFHRAGQITKAITYYTQSADRAADALAFERAARLYQASLDLSGADAPAAPDLSRKLADALANAGQGRQAADMYLRVAGSSPPSAVLELRRRAAYHYCASGHIARGRDEFAAILGQIGMRLPQSPRTAIASCLWHRLRLRLRGLGFRSRRESELSPDELAALDITWSVSVGLTMIDTIHAADYQARNLLRALRAGEPYRLVRALAWQACHTATGGAGAQRQTQRLLDTAEAIIPGVDNPHATGLLTIARGITAFFQGDWARGLDRCDAGEEVLRESCNGVVWERATARSFALWCLYFLGDTRELMHRQPELLREARQRGDLLAEASLTNLSGTLMWLARDRLHEARQGLAEAMRPWEGLGFRTQHFTSLASHVQIDLYGGDIRAACHRLESEWPQLRRSMLLHIEAIRIFMRHLRGSCAVAAAQSGIDRVRSTQLARRCAARLAREKASWGRSLAQLILAALADMEGNRNRAVSLLNVAASYLEQARMGLYAAAARYRQGELLGGDGGLALRSTAEAWLAAHQVSNGPAMVNLFVPGFGSPAPGG